MRGTLGQYHIFETLGKGSTCKVKLAENVETGTKVAVKIIDEKVARNQFHKNILMNEVVALSQISHPNIERYISHGESQYVKKSGKFKDVSYVVLELC